MTGSVTPLDLQSIKAVARQAGRALSDPEALALLAALEEANLARRLRKAANAGRSARLKRLTAIRKRSEKLAETLSLDDDARADLDILTPPDGPDCELLSKQLRGLAALAAPREEQVRRLEGAASGRARDDAIADLAAIAERRLGIDPQAAANGHPALFTEFVRSAFKLRVWGRRRP